MPRRRTADEIADIETTILAYAYEYERQHRRMPTMSELSRELNITRDTAYWLTERLHAYGHMKPLSNGWVLRREARRTLPLRDRAGAIQAQVKAMGWKGKGE